MQIVTTRDGSGQGFIQRAALSPRERQVLQKVSSGLSNKEVAHELGISQSTVKSYLSRLMGELGFQSRVALTRWALLNPDAFAGLAVETTLHAPGCKCPGEFCTAVRSMDQGRPAA